MNDLIERFKRMSDSLREQFEALSDRERRLVLILVAVLGLFVTVLPVYLLSSSVSSLEDENEELRTMIRDFHRNEAQLREIAAKRNRAKARYARKPPQLSSFVAEQSKRFGIEVREFSDQPNRKEVGFTRHHLRVKLPNGLGLRPIMKFLEAVDNSVYPIAIERVKIEHYQAGDSYNGVEVDVISFERALGTTS